MLEVNEEVIEEEKKRPGYTRVEARHETGGGWVTRTEARPITPVEARPATRAETHHEARAEARPETRVEVGGDNRNAHVAACQTPDGDALV